MSGIGIRARQHARCMAGGARPVLRRSSVSCARVQRERRELRAHLGCGLWVRHGAAGSVGTGVGGGGAIASELEPGGHRHKHGERRGSTEYSPRSFVVARRKRGCPSARRDGSVVLDARLGIGLGTTAKQQKASAAAARAKGGYGLASKLDEEAARLEARAACSRVQGK